MDGQENRACFGCQIKSNVWTDPNRMPIINFVATTPEGSRLVGTTNAEGEFKSAEYLTREMLKIIEEIGSANVCVQM